MLFHYIVIDQDGKEREGEIDAPTEEGAINALQRRGYVISSIRENGAGGGTRDVFNMRLSFLDRVSNKDIVIISRQIATLFEAQVSALRVFRLLATETHNRLLGETLTAVADELQGGSSISKALSKHPKVFSPFYVNMVAAGEETGKLNETFEFLASYLDRTYEVTSKAKHALIYPAFVIATFFAVMGLMLTVVIPKIATILEESGQEVPIYTKIVLWLSHAATSWVALVFILLLAALAVWATFYIRTEKGRYFFDELKLSIPVLGNLYQKLYLTRVADNLSTMLGSGISMVRALEVCASVVGSAPYEEALTMALTDVRNGKSVSAAFGEHKEFPTILVQMIRVGEESGELGSILKTLGTFYQREVMQAVDTLVGLIEPAMIILLGGGVGVLLASVLLPIYSITGSIQ